MYAPADEKRKLTVPGEASVVTPFNKKLNLNVFAVVSGWSISVSKSTGETSFLRYMFMELVLLGVE